MYRFCLGDAVHRHPPNHGLGSNTCIQDAHNLAWKIAYALKGLRSHWLMVAELMLTINFLTGSAGKELLETYNDERQPVGLNVITQ